jgi:hypothetical protein
VKRGFKAWYDPRPYEREIVLVSLGPHVVGAARPHPDLSDPVSKVMGAAKRIAREPPPVDLELFDEFEMFVRNYVKKLLKPLPRDSDVSLDHWLDQTKYTIDRKNILRRRYQELMDGSVAWRSKKVKLNKGFVKPETYGQFKFCRWIMSRSDWAKVLFGPICKLIESEVYKLPEFIKHVPVRDRPEHIMKQLFVSGRNYLVTDYTAFESHFTPFVMRACEYVLYDHMVSSLPEKDEFKMQFEQMVLNKQRIASRNVVFSTTGRMSGEMFTSIGNGFSNLMLMKFAAYKSGCVVDGFVEGDDGVFVEREGCVDEGLFARLGFNMKFKRVPELTRASFCGIVCDDKVLHTVADPAKHLLTFAWIGKQYKMASEHTKMCLLKARGYSLCYQYPNAPILKDLGCYILRMTAHVDDRDVKRVMSKARIEEHRKEEFFNAIALKLPVGKVEYGSRLVCEQEFGFPVETQVEYEKILDSKKDFKPMTLPNLDLYVHGDCLDYYDRFYAKTLNFGDHDPVQIHHTVDSGRFDQLIERIRCDDKTLFSKQCENSRSKNR